MCREWAEYDRRVNLWQATGDTERMGLIDLYREGWQLQETHAEQSFALFTRGRNEARRLNEPWWVLFFEHWRLNAITCFAGDYVRALPLALELMVRFNAPDGQSHEFRNWILMHVLAVYTSIDPHGYRDEIERSFAYLDRQIARGPTNERVYLEILWVDYRSSTERWDTAYEVALRLLALVDQSQDHDLRVWHGTWTLFKLCRVCHALGRVDELAGHADHMAELSGKCRELRRTQADAWIWRAVTARAKGDERNASRCFHRSMRLLAGVERRDLICADSIATYKELCGDLKAAVGVRDREIAAATKKGELHRVCQAHVERCRLLTQAGEITPADLNAARLAAGKLRLPGWFLEKIERIETTDRREDHP